LTKNMEHWTSGSEKQWSLKHGEQMRCLIVSFLCWEFLEESSGGVRELPELRWWT
jgi:hypothetical protein